MLSAACRGADPQSRASGRPLDTPLRKRGISGRTDIGGKTYVAMIAPMRATERRRGHVPSRRPWTGDVSAAVRATGRLELVELDRLTAEGLDEA